MEGFRPVDYHSRVIDKQAVHVIIETQSGRIEGNIHVMINHRPSDVLNDETKFIAVTDATITSCIDDSTQKRAFIALSKLEIKYLSETGQAPKK